MEILDAEAELEQEPNMPSAHLAAMFDAQGPMRIASPRALPAVRPLAKLPNL